MLAINSNQWEWIHFGTCSPGISPILLGQIILQESNLITAGSPCGSLGHKLQYFPDFQEAVAVADHLANQKLKSKDWSADDWLVVWNIFFHILGIVTPTDEFIFFRGVGLNHQPDDVFGNGQAQTPAMWRICPAGSCFDVNSWCLESLESWVNFNHQATHHECTTSVPLKFRCFAMFRHDKTHNSTFHVMKFLMSCHFPCGFVWK